MDCVRAIKIVLDIIKKPIDLAREHRRLGHKLENGLQNLKDDLDIMKEDLKSYQELQLLELVYDIEDFVLGLWIPEASGIALSAFAMDPREGYLDRIESFQKRIERLEKRQEKSPESRSERGGGCSADASRGDDPASSSAAREESLVGIMEHKNLLVDLINPASTRPRDQASGQEAGQRPKVISIVGCTGVGKTALARAVYDHYRDSDDFNCVAWVEASECNNKTALLGKIIEKVQADLARRATPVPSEGDGNAASPDLHGILADKRYLVFIDDMQLAEVCDDIEHVFPGNGHSSMLIVTTSVHSVADVCSSGSYVYTMQRLPPNESEKLFWKSVGSSGGDPAPALRDGSQSILSKCDGLPLALISVATYLRRTKGRKLVTADCVMVGKELGRHLIGGEAEGFRELRRALGQCYDGLPQSDYKSCMLYLSIFPRNHPIKRKSLVRRLIAEGLVANSDPKTLDELLREMDHGQECLEGLVNRCIVEPVQVCSCSKNIKSCPVNGVMLEFIIHKSQSTNLVTLIRKEEVVRNTNGHIRRLSVQSSTKDKFDEVERNVGLSGIRSLTIFSSNVFVPSSSKKNFFKGSELFDIKKYKFLRLIDLDDCKGLDQKVLVGICALVYLKYLSLRKTDVKKIPREIKKLQRLQTLDIRETREIELPIEAIMLPKLAFLFGQFVLPRMSNDTKQFLSTTSELHTLAGFVVDKADGSEQIILEARNLRKIEVWYKDTCASPNPQTSTTQKLIAFVLSLQKHLTSLDSLSIHSSQLSQDILATLEKGPCKISSMKLWGKLVKLPGIATLSQLNTLSKLQLFYTGLTSDDLSILQHISCLEYLKLQDNQNDSWGGSFSVLKDGFKSLRRLCFQASKLPKLQFDTESMKSLISLHLLCPDISQMQVAEEISKSIAHITSLDEVMLHSSATREMVEAWETAAKNNANRPYVKRQPKPISAAA